MMHYETKVMTYPQMAHFLRLFDAEIGTDREITEPDTGVYYVVCFELENRNEVTACQTFEALSR